MELVGCRGISTLGVVEGYLFETLSLSWFDIIGPMLTLLDFMKSLFSLNMMENFNDDILWKCVIFYYVSFTSFEVVNH